MEPLGLRTLPFTRSGELRPELLTLTMAPATALLPVAENDTSSLKSLVSERCTANSPQNVG